MQEELVNNTSKLTGIDKDIKIYGQKSKEVEEDSTYFEEKKQLHKDKLGSLNIEQQQRLKTLSLF